MEFTFTTTAAVPHMPASNHPPNKPSWYDKSNMVNMQVYTKILENWVLNQK